MLSRSATIVLLVASMPLTGADSTQADPTLPTGVDPLPPQQWRASLESAFEHYDIVTAAVGVISDGELARSYYFGEQRPGIPADGSTLFNVASITKTITTEALLRLVDAGVVSLDQSMSGYWIDPDLASDPRHHDLTPRLVLNHQTGLPNWRFFSADGTLSFVADPGSRYGYSGEGFEYLSRFLEQRLDQPFDQIVRRQVFEPLSLTSTALAVRESNFPRIARAVDAEGEFHGYYCRPQSGWCRKPGEYSAADDLVTTLPEFARFLIAVMDAEGYGSELAAERNRVQTDKGTQAVVLCDRVEAGLCPRTQGYGLGWDVLDYGEFQVLSHGGSDWSEVALTYFYTGSRDGVIIFLNAPGQWAIQAIPAAIRGSDRRSPLLDLYVRRAAKAAEAGKRRQSAKHDE